jgi:predicted phosphohydrolase
MKIQYASDLHLEFKDNFIWMLEHHLKPVGDILILNGDITVLYDNFKENEVFDIISRDFKQTYIVPGNHEFYSGYDMKNALTLDIDIRHNVKLINNQSIVIEDTKIIFTTLWTHIKDRLIENYLNDFHQSIFDGKRLNTESYNLLHQKCVVFLEQELKNNKAEKTIVVSHHIPTNKTNGYVGGDPLFSQAFVVNLESLLAKYKIDYWLYGHNHVNKNCEAFAIKFRSNQLGYVAHNEHTTFNREAVIDLNEND